MIETEIIELLYSMPLHFAFFFRNIPGSSLKFVNEIAINLNCLYNYIKSHFKTNY